MTTFIASTVPHPEASAAVTVTGLASDGFVRLFNGKNLNGLGG